MPDIHPAPDCTLVIFGAGGDLTGRLLMPALYNLACGHLLPEGFRVIGVDHGDGDDDTWRHELTAVMQSFTRDQGGEFYTPKLDEAAWRWISQRLHYQRGDFSADSTFARVRQALGNGSAIFYLAVPARFFGPIVEALGKTGLLREGEGAFRRVVIEKPFGADLPSAEELNRRILKQADERQYFRIDHFLGKETVQSIMAVRFANGMFEPTWRREYIDHVQITAAETVGVEGRGRFYEPTGALRDMVPNHLFTLLCMVAMEPPNSFDADEVRAEKAKLLRAICAIGPQDAVRGQYAAGHENGRAVPAYRTEPNVAGDSATETYVALRLQIENWRWSGVPFYLRTGKRLAERRSEIAIHYRAAPARIFRDSDTATTSCNVLRLLIDPEQAIETRFDAKAPGARMRLGQVASVMRYKAFFDEPPSVGYETLLYDCMIGDGTLFQRADAIEAGWRAVLPVQRAWAEDAASLEFYDAGSQGPAGADRLLQADGRQWLKLGE